MLKKHSLGNLPDQSKNHNNLSVEIFPDKDEVKLLLGKKEAWIKIKDLYGLVFLMVGDKEKDSMIPVQEIKGDRYIRQLHIICQKDMKKGEELVINYNVDIPKTISYKESNEYNNKDNPTQQTKI